MVGFGLAWLGLVWLGLAWLDTAWFGLVWGGLVGCGLVWFGAQEAQVGNRPTIPIVAPLQPLKTPTPVWLRYGAPLRMSSTPCPVLSSTRSFVRS